MRLFLALLAVVAVIRSGCSTEQPVIPAMDDLICYFPCEATEDGAPLDLVESDVEAEYKWKDKSLVDGPFGHALRNHGAGQRDLIRQGLDLGTDDFTIAFWVNPKGYSWQDYAGNGGKGWVVYGHKPELLLFLNDAGRMALKMPDADNATMFAERTPQKNAWNHIAFVVDRDNDDGCKIYLNGQEVPMSSVNMAHSVNHGYNIENEFLIGRTVVGDLDEVAVYRKALSAKEVAAMCRRIPKVETVMKTSVVGKSETTYPPRRKPYRVIYQINPILALENSFDIEDYINGIAGFLDIAEVDAVFWHDGAGGNTANYDSDVLELTGERIGKTNLFLKKLIADGNDPPKVAIREIKKRGADIFYSYRLNDCHDSIRGGKRRPDLLAAFKLDNPEWTIGHGQEYGGPYHLNFAVPEVRDLKFSVIEEIFRKYDFDGLELDFMRNPPYFIPKTEPENAHILTQFLRRVREHLNQRGEERGQPIALAVRVTEGLEGCRLDGFEVPTWIEERLIDIIIMGSNSIDIEVEAFKALAKGTDILVYPCLYFFLPNWPNGLNAEMVRALATNYHYQGADGIYTFNWFVHNYVHRPERAARFEEQFDWLREINDPDAMRGKDKRYVADRGGPSIWYPHGRLHCVLPVTLAEGSRTNVTVMIGEDLTRRPKPKDIELSIELGGVTDENVFEVMLNEKMLTTLEHTEIEMTNVFGRVMTWTGLTGSLEPTQLIAGRNRFELSAIAGAFIVKGIEFDVSY